MTFVCGSFPANGFAGECPRVMWEATFDEDSDTVTECGGATPAASGGPTPTSRMVASMDANPDKSNSTLSKIYNINQRSGSILNKEQTRQLR